MKRIIYLAVILLHIPFESANSSATNSSSGEDVQGIYQKVEAKGYKALDKYGSLVEIEEILEPIKLESGEYKVEITRKGDHLYLIEGTSYYLEMKYCYEYSYKSKAILQIKNSYRPEGTIYFLK